jgi:hypothetical protein
MASKFSDEEEREIELALEVRRRHAKEISDAKKKEEDEKAKDAWDGKSERRANERRKIAAKKDDKKDDKKRPSLFRKIA